MKIGILLTVIIFCTALARAQSTSQDFPTPVLTNEINGSIKARDIGDSRLTSYFYTFNGDQGDLFVNIVTRNFTGDLDIFAVNGLRPVTKIVIYAIDAENETGRALYFRKNERLLLRIQGRSPNDDSASFRIKFAGSFVAAKESDAPAGPELPKVDTGRDSGIRVNSVGTILPPPPKPVVTDNADAETQKISDKDGETASADVEPKADTENPSKGLEIVVTDNLPKKDEPSAAAPTSSSRRSRTPAKTKVAKLKTVIALETKTGEAAKEKVKEEIKAVEPLPVKKPAQKRNVLTARKPAEPKEPFADPLASIRLVIAFKDGKSLEKAMNEVFKFSVDKGILTVILKDGSISRYPIVDVAKVTIQ